MNDTTVSFDDELLICVDEDDNVVGYKSKVDCHAGDAILHRAFSIFIFNEAGELLVQQRSEEKPLWPLFWSNSCCSHPRKGETVEEAAYRRLQEELDLETDLKYLYKFQYYVPYNEEGSEREICSVFLGTTSEDPTVNTREVADWKWMPPAEVDREMKQHPDKYSPWFKMEWQRIRTDYKAELEAVLGRESREKS